MEKRSGIIRCEHLYDGSVKPRRFTDGNGNEYEFCSEGCMNLIAAQYQIRFNRAYEDSLVDKLETEEI